jgi:transaldolase
MKATQRLHDLGQSLWLDNITRGLLTKGTLRHYIIELSVMGLTSKGGYSKLREEIWQ